MTTGSSVQSSPNMNDVKSMKPPSPPDEDLLHPSLLSPNSHLPIAAVSPAFQELINRLVQQHVIEMSLLDSNMPHKQAWANGKRTLVLLCVRTKSASPQVPAQLLRSVVLFLNLAFLLLVPEIRTCMLLKPRDERPFQFVGLKILPFGKIRVLSTETFAKKAIAITITSI